MMKRGTTRAISLMYHDVVAEAAESGFPGAAAARYKLAPAQFQRHLAAIRQAVATPPCLVTELLAASTVPAHGWMLTFDDGGVSAYTEIADALEAVGWRGHFFITTDFLGHRAFLTPAQIRELHERGHVIGSHSCSHPLRFAACSWHEMKREWSESVAALSDLLGERVRVASLPGGQYSAAVAETAAAAGIQALFTSEPTSRCTRSNGCLILGRYAMQRWTTPQVAAALASRQGLSRHQQWLWWEAKKLAKRLSGTHYVRWREAWSEERHQTR